MEGEQIPSVQNTDRQLWQKTPGDYYSPSIHVTAEGHIGINVGGTVVVRAVEEWHALAHVKTADIKQSIEELLLSDDFHRRFAKAFYDTPLPAAVSVDEQIERLEQLEGDWRIGLTVKPKYSHHELKYEQGEVLNVFTSGHGGIFDKDGVLKIKMPSGRVILEPADNWVTA